MLIKLEQNRILTGDDMEQALNQFIRTLAKGIEETKARVDIELEPTDQAYVCGLRDGIELALYLTVGLVDEEAFLLLTRTMVRQKVRP